LVAAIFFASAAFVSAQASPQGNDYERSAIAALMTRFGMSEVEVRRHLAAQHSARQTYEALRRSLGADYGGAWYDQERFVLVVAVTRSQRHADVRRSGAYSIHVERSFEYLSSVKEDLMVEAAVRGWFDSIAAVHIDQKQNVVVVEVLQEFEREFSDQLVSSGLDSRSVRVHRVESRPRLLADIYRGDRFRNVTIGGRCSVGFAVQEGGYLTAAHCGSVGHNVVDANFEPQGTFAGSTYPPELYYLPPEPEAGFPGGWFANNNTDVAWVKTHPGWTPRAPRIIGHATPYVGEFVCRIGATTGHHCGDVTTLGGTVVFGSSESGGVAVPHHPLIGVSTCGAGGDSGGPLFSMILGDYAEVAHGTLTGGGGTLGCPGDKTSRTYFAPVETALQHFGLTLKSGW
jgi:streptogrisin C